MEHKKVLLLGVFFVVASVGTSGCMDIFEMVKNGQIITATKLVNRQDFNPNLVNSAGEPLIFLAVEKGNISFARTIIDKPTFDPHIKNKNGDTILSFVSSKGHASLADVIISHKNFNSTNGLKQNTVDCAAACEQAYKNGYFAGIADARKGIAIVIAEELKQATQNIENRI